MNLTIRFANEVPRNIQKLILELAKEEIPHRFLHERQLLLGGFGIKLEWSSLRKEVTGSWYWYSSIWATLMTSLIALSDAGG